MQRGWRIRGIEILITFVVAGCASLPPPPERPDYGAKPTPAGAHAAVLAHVRRDLKDPDSIKSFVVAEPRPDCFYDDRGWECGWKTCVSFNAKNSYGAYAGAETFVFMLRGDNFWAGGSQDIQGKCPAHLDESEDWKG